MSARTTQRSAAAATGLLLVLGLLQCGGGSPRGPQDPGPRDVPAADTPAPVDDTSGPSDEAGSDEGEPREDAPGQEGTRDESPADAAPDAPEPGTFLAPCRENTDCDSKFCVMDQGTQVCTRTCLDGCPAGWSCSQVAGTGGDLTFVCTSRFWALCRPCSQNADCEEGGLAARCVAYGPDGRFCGADCTEDSDCPSGYGCRNTDDTTGRASRQCVALSGTCDCTPRYVALGLHTTCQRTAEVGTCLGTRTCSAAGLTDCTAPVPSPEVCDGVDNDCDGATDEQILACCVCGDGKCQAFCETGETCCTDCHVCGDGKCGCGEGFQNCPQDCCGTCGDGKCARYGVGGTTYCTEDETNCPQDCHPSACGNGLCESGESVSQCPADCVRDVCGNHVCEPTDGGPTGCPEDCAATCGNCHCEGTETSDTCPGDCGTCGDGVCSGCAALSETQETCYRDCCVPHLGREVCDGIDNNCDGTTDPPGSLGCTEHYVDADKDGYGGAVSRCLCGPDDLFTTPKPGDCDDADPATFPGTPEACNGKDENCDGVSDPPGSLGCTAFFLDADGDSYGTPGMTKCLCTAAPPYTATRDGDCDDDDPHVNPAAVESCNGRDDNCNGSTDEGLGTTTCGQGICRHAVGNCVDGRAPACDPLAGAAAETCNDLDDNCDGRTDEAGALGCTPYFADRDGDGWGTNEVECLCAPDAPSTALAGGDCDDGEVSVHPGAAEACDGVDQDCDGRVDEVCPATGAVLGISSARLGGSDGSVILEGAAGQGTPVGSFSAPAGTTALCLGLFCYMAHPGATGSSGAGGGKW